MEIFGRVSRATLWEIYEESLVLVEFLGIFGKLMELFFAEIDGEISGKNSERISKGNSRENPNWRNV